MHNNMHGAVNGRNSLLEEVNANYLSHLQGSTLTEPNDLHSNNMHGAVNEWNSLMDPLNYSTDPLISEDKQDVGADAQRTTDVDMSLETQTVIHTSDEEMKRV